MKNKLLICSLLIFFVTTNLTYAQNKSLNLNLLYELRVTPVYFSGIGWIITAEDNKVFYTQDKQLSGFALGFQLQKSIFTPNLNLSYTQYLRYDHLFYEDRLPDQDVHKSVNEFTTDILFGINYYLPVKKFGFRIGSDIGLMFRGSNYSFSSPLSPSGGIFTAETNFNYNAIIPYFAYEKNRFSVYMKAILTTKHKFRQPSQMLIPVVGVKYRLHKFGDKE